MARLGSENPFVAAIDLAQSLSAQEDPNAPLLLLAALDLHEARTQSLAGNTGTLVSDCTHTLRATPENELSDVEALCTPFLEGLRSGARLDALRRLLDDMHIRCLLNHPNAIGLTPVMLSAAFGRLDVLCALEARGAFVDAINEHTGENVLHYAAMAGDRGEAVKRYILDHHPEILARFDDCSPSNNSGRATTSAFNAKNVVVPYVADRTTPAEGRTKRRP